MMSACRVIACVNQKGGTGKTTTAENLGVGLAMEGRRVLLIDADPQASLSIALGCRRPDELPVTLSNILADVIDDVPQKADRGIIHQAEGIDLLPASIELSGMDLRLLSAMNRERILRAYVDTQRPRYDCILIDCMPSLGLLTVNALSAADSVLIPTQPQYLSVKGLELLLGTVAKVRRQINPALKIDGIVLTMTDRRASFTREISALLRDRYGASIRVFDTEIPRSVRAVEATAEGKSIFAYDRSGKVAEAYANLTKEVISLERQREKCRADAAR